MSENPKFQPFSRIYVSIRNNNKIIEIYTTQNIQRIHQFPFFFHVFCIQSFYMIEDF